MKTLEPARPTTIDDLAREVGVTKSTISRALAGKGNFSAATREAIHDAAKRLNFEPNPHAQRLSNGGSPNMVALFSLMLDRGVATQKLQYLQRFLAGKGYEAPSYAYGYCAVTEAVGQAPLLASLRRQKPRAIVCNTTDFMPETLQELERYRDEGGIIIAYDNPVDIDCDKVIFDRADNAYQAVRHLLDLGHRDIGFFTQLPFDETNQRHVGYRRALGEAGIRERDEWLFAAVSEDDITTGAYEDAGYQIAQQVLALRDRPTAMVISNDNAAAGFAATMHRAGVRIPEDMSLVGQDDSLIARHGFLELTTVSQPVQLIAETVFKLLMDRLDGNYTGLSRTVTIKGDLIVRKSTLPYKKPKN
jgi:DNA-binding LacI/PurR family transcriptional regulator